jgi:hypothetical protein
MLDLPVTGNTSLQYFLLGEDADSAIHTSSPEERVKLLVIRDLIRLGWNVSFKSNKVLITPPTSYDRQTIREAMQIKRQESLAQHSEWISAHLDLARKNLASGTSAWNSSIEPMIEVCESQRQHDIFRIFRFYWSSPYSEYVGRRIKLLIRDNSLSGKPLIGIAALGSSIVHIPDRDKWIGWGKNTRTQNLVYTMDAYVLGALPPYGHLLGGKLISYIIASNEVREIYRQKYEGVVTNISKRTASHLACVFTTSLYGKSSQYNRVKYDDRLLYIPAGETKGFGTLHLTDETFEAMRGLLEARGIAVTNRFGDGPIWRMRVIRTVADVLGFNADALLKHSFRRQIYAIPLAHNFREFLTGEHDDLDYCNYPLDSLVEHWRTRWLGARKTNPEIRDAVREFQPEFFSI